MREMHVVLFLANHPAHDTARDVTELRGLAKSQVSAAVDLLAARELLRRQPGQGRPPGDPSGADRCGRGPGPGGAEAPEYLPGRAVCRSDTVGGGAISGTAGKGSDQRGSAVEGRRQYMSRRNVDLGSGSVGKLLFSLAVPTITSQIVNMLYNLVDRVYIGHMQPVETVGKLALTGVGVCLPIIMVISAFAALMAFRRRTPGLHRRRAGRPEGVGADHGQQLHHAGGGVRGADCGLSGVCGTHAPHLRRPATTPSATP